MKQYWVNIFATGRHGAEVYREKPIESEDDVLANVVAEAEYRK